ncbi:DnaB-like helicase C-terminal domain-containing protein, partial [Janthinobacterium sp.]|uniref:DnaB-like helicase C-terminal domain-containing protein n=1 Tax=Janthinobacterium sp. TaxID=1871054 RepID=UPI0025BFB162
LDTKKPVTGLSTGLSDLDYYTRGLHPGALIVLAARPGAGKSSLALQIALEAATQGPVAFFSVEMGQQEQALRALADWQVGEIWSARYHRRAPIGGTLPGRPVPSVRHGFDRYGHPEVVHRIDEWTSASFSVWMPARDWRRGLNRVFQARFLQALRSYRWSGRQEGGCARDAGSPAFLSASTRC